MEGGTLSLHPESTQVVRIMATEASDPRLAPWPRVLPDLCATDVRDKGT